MSVYVVHACVARKSQIQGDTGGPRDIIDAVSQLHYNVVLT